MADITDPTTPLITTAASATVANDSSQELLMRLRDGSRHETVAGQPQQYNISTFDITDMPLALSQQSEVHLGRMDTAIYALPMSALLERTHGPDAKRFLDRVAQPLRLSGGLPGADAGGRSAGRGLAARRQEFRLGLHHSAGRLYYSSPISASRWAARTGSPRSRGMDGQHALRRGRHLSALADGLRRPHSLNAITTWVSRPPSQPRCRVQTQWRSPHRPS